MPAAMPTVNAVWGQRMRKKVSKLDTCFSNCSDVGREDKFGLRAVNQSTVRSLLLPWVQMSEGRFYSLEAN